MLSRSGNKVYGMGRYLERSEFATRFMKVQSEFLMDLPITQRKDEVLEFVLHMAGSWESYYAKHSQLKVEDVCHFICIEEANPASILAHIGKVRELASGIRDVLSPELWEYINCFYHTMINYSADVLHKEGIYGFTHKVASETCLIKGYIHDSMIRNEVWMLLSLGIYLEKAILVNRMLLHQMQVMARQEASDQVRFHESPYFVLILESMGAYGMFKQLYQKNANRNDTLHFLVVNKDFPKSVSYALDCSHNILKNLYCLRQEDRDLLASTSYAVLSQCKDFDPGEQSESIVHFLEKMQDSLHELAGQIEQTFQRFIPGSVSENLYNHTNS